MTAGLPVPPGFVISGEAYLAAIDASGAREKLVTIRSGLDPEDDSALTAASELSRSLIETTPIPDDLASQVRDAYRQLGPGHPGRGALVRHGRGFR